jgi:hypothetical protein
MVRRCICSGPNKLAVPVAMTRKLATAPTLEKASAFPILSRCFVAHLQSLSLQVLLRFAAVKTPQYSTYFRAACQRLPGVMDERARRDAGQMLAACGWARLSSQFQVAAKI